MSLVFSGALAAAFYTLVLGAIWPARNGSDFAASLLGLIAKSLWLSWLIVAASYWLDLDVPILALFGAVIASLIYQWLRGGRKTVLTNAFPVVLVLIVTAGLCLFYYLGGLGSDYRMIFVTNDALASWNRWAIELSKNTYAPYDAAYPLLFPGIWSLVYKAQGVSSIWIFAKMTMFVIPIILAGTICLLFSSRMVITALAYAAFAGVFFFFSNAYPMLLGNMDIPVTAMCMASGVAMVVAVQKMHHGEDVGDTVILAALFAGLASITKQPGTVMLPPLLILIGVGLWNRKLGRLDAFIAFAVAAIPLSTFLSMFLAQQPDPLGNLVNLERITKIASPNPLAMAWHHVEGMMPLWMLAVLALLALANVFYLRRLSGWLGVLFLVLAVAGFFGFAKCCSYDARNGWWIVSLLATSALFTTARLDPSKWFAAPVIRTPAHYLPTAVAGLTVLVAVMVRDRVSDNEVASQQFHQEETLPGPDVSLILRKTLQPILNRGDVLLSEHQAVRWFPGMVTTYLFCVSSDAPCIKTVFNSPLRGRIFVLTQRGVLEYPSMAPLLKPEKLMAESGGYELYGPFNAIDVQSIGD